MKKTLSPVALWLFICAAALFLTTMVGAVTRLTESGLSIVEWKPLTGAVPPLNETAWQHEFNLYQASPQYQDVNKGMSLEDFKHIYFWEWLHRLIDRLIGVLYLIPFLWFWKRGYIPAERKKPLLGLFVLGGMQGVLGWAMVKSGLVDRPAVSHYLLAAHLMLALTIYCCLLRAGFLFSGPPEADAKKVSSMRGLVRFAVGMAAITMTWGAFTAGLRAGVLYDDTFPYMGQHLWPGEMFSFYPWWRNFFENAASVQFTHRVLAVLTFCTLMIMAVKGLKQKSTPRLARLFVAVQVMACVQVGLGISTLESHVNVVVATLHQAGALTIMALLMALLHNIPCKRSLIWTTP